MEGGIQQAGGCHGRPAHTAGAGGGDGQRGESSMLGVLECGRVVAGDGRVPGGREGDCDAVERVAGREREDIPGPSHLCAVVGGCRGSGSKERSAGECTCMRSTIEAIDATRVAVTGD